MPETSSHNGCACPLCLGRELVLLKIDAERRYLRCATCDLISVHPHDRPSPSEESQRYLAHRNDAADAGYVQFLERLADPLCDVVPVGSRGIDVGCGPAPVLAGLLTERGRPTRSYDPLFFPDVALLRERYDFVTCSEVVEHAHDPAALLRQLVGLVEPGGTVGIMTSLHHDALDFGTWWYRRDITHVCFFSAHTMRWVAQFFDLSLSLPAANVALFALPRPAPSAT